MHAPDRVLGPKDTKIAVERTNGQQCLNIHDAIDLETAQTAVLEAATVDQIGTSLLLTTIEAMYPANG